MSYFLSFEHVNTTNSPIHDIITVNTNSPIHDIITVAPN